MLFEIYIQYFSMFSLDDILFLEGMAAHSSSSSSFIINHQSPIINHKSSILNPES
jgi:hypothetical protein